MVYNPYIVVPFATWAVAQVAKFAIAAFKGRINFRYLYASGGMPSVHSAVVCSLATTALLIDGAGSHLFGFAAIFAAIVMYDSFGVRRSTGEQAVAINMLIDSLERNRVRLDRPAVHLREILGHQPQEVTVGAIVGVVLAGLFNYDRLGWLMTFAQSLPSRPEMLAYAVVFAVMLVGGVVVRLWVGRRYRGSKIIKQVLRRVLVLTQTVGWLGLGSMVLVYERASYLGWRMWPELVIVVGLLWGVAVGLSFYKVVPEELAQESQRARKQKWLLWGRDKGRRKAKA